MEVARLVEMVEMELHPLFQEHLQHTQVVVADQFK
jgi:hypothetical protein